MAARYVLTSFAYQEYDLLIHHQYSYVPPKRLQGRPPGSKNKKAGAPEPTAGDASTSASPKRLRGRPAKRKAEPEGAAGVLYSSVSEPRPKRKKGSDRTSPQPPQAQMSLEERPSKVSQV